MLVAPFRRLVVCTNKRYSQTVNKMADKDLELSARFHLMWLKRRAEQGDFPPTLIKKMEGAMASGQYKTVIAAGLSATQRAKLSYKQQLQEAIDSENPDVDEIMRLLDKLSWQ